MGGRRQAGRAGPAPGDRLGRAADGGRRRPAGCGLGGVVAATAAFAVHSGFDFVWHLRAVVLTVTLLVGVIVPAPRGAGARTLFRTAPGKEPDENQIAS
jgi:hypothetical protein